jgi:hypothetical protein
MAAMGEPVNAHSNKVVIHDVLNIIPARTRYLLGDKELDTHQDALTSFLLEIMKANRSLQGELLKKNTATVGKSGV